MLLFLRDGWGPHSSDWRNQLALESMLVQGLVEVRRARAKKIPRGFTKSRRICSKCPKTPHPCNFPSPSVHALTLAAFAVSCMRACLSNGQSKPQSYRAWAHRCWTVAHLDTPEQVSL